MREALMIASNFARASALVIAAALLAGCDQPTNGQAQAQGAAPAPPQVTVAQPLRRVFADEAEVVGRFVAVDSVEMRARVSGYLDGIEFRDGQLVEKGQLLFRIDRRPFLATLEQARATLQQSKANLEFATSNLDRAEGLRRGTVISEQSLDERIQAKRVAEASVLAQEAAVRQAELDLQFTELRAPVAGRIGDRRVSQGNLVTGGSGGTTTLLATIQSTDPIRFEFTLDEATYLAFMRRYGEKALTDPDIPVRLKLLDDTDFSRKGRIDFIDNALSRTAGVIRFRAVFDNRDALLTPGMFGRIRFEITPPAQALLVPDAAIGTELANRFVMVVDNTGTAKPSYVTLGPIRDGLRVIRTGLKAEDRVIINGLLRVRPGSKVTPQDGTIVSASTAAGSAPSTGN
ncbi:MAG: efflux RND transporter periplasmic adaptor subunit [Hyphomicrobiaceae bacterium]